jgi:hypothetical protein
MKTYLYNADTLKPRIKKLKKALLACEGIDDVSLGTCRDLVAQSLEWDGWNDLYQGHQKNNGVASLPPYELNNVMFTGRWYDSENHKREARLLLTELIHTTFSDRLGDTLSFSLAEKVWPTTAFEFNKKSTVHTGEIAPEHWRDGLLIDSETQEGFIGFRKNVLLPHVAKHGGIVFCSPGELKNILSYFNDQEEQEHYVLVGDDYHDLFNEHDLQPSSILSRLSWEDNEDSTLKNVVEHLLRTHVEGKISPSDVGLFLDAQFSENQVRSFQAPACNNVASEVLDKGAANTINGFLNRLIDTRYRLPPLSVMDIPRLDKPVVMVTNSESLLAHSVLSPLMHHFYAQFKAVQERQQGASSSTPPKLLVLGYRDQLTLPGFGAYTIYSGAANWSLVLPQHMKLDRGYTTTEMPTLVANVGNIIHIKPITFLNKLLRKPQAQWFTLRFSGLRVEDTMRALAGYHYEPEKTAELLPCVDIMW